MADQMADIANRLNLVNQQEKDLLSQLAQYENEFKNDDGSNTNAYYIAGAELRKIQAQKPQVLQEALKAGVDLRPYYGTTYADAVKFKQDLGQYAGKDQSMIIPANPVGYGGQFQFDPNFGSSFYRDLATKSGKALGLSDEQILQKGTEYFADKFASGAQTKGVIGFTDFGSGLIDSFATTAGVPAERLDELKGTALKPLYDASASVFNGLNGAARVESQSSGFFKGIGADIAKLGPLGTIALTAALGPAGAGLSTALAGSAAGALPGLLQGDLSGALKGGAIGGIGGGALSGVNAAVSNALGGGALGTIAGGSATGALTGGAGALISGGDLGQGILKGGLLGGASGAGNALGNTLQNANAPLGSGVNFGPNAGARLGIGGGSSLQLGGGITPPANFDFGPVFELPNTTGYVNTKPEIGGLFDEIKFPSVGLNPNTLTNQDFGSGTGQGLQAPQSPNVGGGLGQGLTVGVAGGILGEGGITPTGEVNLGNPNSFINGGTEGTLNTPKLDVKRLMGGLLGAGALAGISSGLLGNNQQAAPRPDLPVQRFAMTPRRFDYQGNPETYGQTDIGNFQFYRPNAGLLG